MIAIENSGLANIGGGNLVNTALMVPVFTVVADYSAKTITVTSASTVSGGAAFKRANIEMTDEQGYTVKGTITTLSGNTGAVSFASLKQTGPIMMKVIATSTTGIINVGICSVSPTRLTATFADYETTGTTCFGQ